HRVAVFLADVLGAALRVEARHLVGQDADLLGAEQARKEQVPVAAELLDLRVIERHRTCSFGRRAAGDRLTPRRGGTVQRYSTCSGPSSWTRTTRSGVQSPMSKSWETMRLPGASSASSLGRRRRLISTLR